MKANNPDGGNITASEVPCAVCCSSLKKYTSAGTMTSPPPIPIIPAKTPAPIPRANPPSKRVFIKSSNSDAYQINKIPAKFGCPTQAAFEIPLKQTRLEWDFFLDICMDFGWSV